MSGPTSRQLLKQHHGNICPPGEQRETGIQALELTNDFHAPLECFVVRLGTHERRKEGVVDIDGMEGMAAAELLRQDLHIPAQWAAASRSFTHWHQTASDLIHHLQQTQYTVLENALPHCNAMQKRNVEPCQGTHAALHYQGNKALPCTKLRSAQPRNAIKMR